MKPQTFLALLLLVIAGCGCGKGDFYSSNTKNGRLILSPTASTECGGRTHLLVSDKENVSIIFAEEISFSNFENEDVIVWGEYLPLFKDCPPIFKVKKITKK